MLAKACNRLMLLRIPYYVLCVMHQVRTIRCILHTQRGSSYCHNFSKVFFAMTVPSTIDDPWAYLLDSPLLSPTAASSSQDNPWARPTDCPLSGPSSSSIDPWDELAPVAPMDEPNVSSSWSNPWTKLVTIAEEEENPIVPCLPDTMGLSAIELDGKVSVLHPWYLLCGGNGHKCIGLHYVDVVDPSINLGHSNSSNMQTFGLTSLHPIKMHITITNRFEEGIFVPIERVREAEAYVELIRQSIPHLIHTQLGMGPCAMGGILTWTTRHLNYSGHSECFALTRTPMSRQDFGVRDAPDLAYVEYVAVLQDRMHAFLNHVRCLLGFYAPKSEYHLSIRRW